MNTALKAALAVSAFATASHAMAQITLYQGNAWHGRAVTATAPVADLGRIGFNDRASSVVVDSGRWEVCDDAGFRGRCVVLREGSYESLAGMGLDNSISSVRPLRRHDRIAREAPTPLPAATYEYRQRPHERIYEAQVTDVRAVMGPPERRCWVERQQVQTDGGGRNVGGALAGALIGGVLGHQIGGGTGRDVATAGGAVAGAAIGSNAGGSTSYTTRDVQRCDTTQNTTPSYWDVTYQYRGIEHHAQMTAAPGSTIPVNSDGLPRM
ncbi:MAG: beta/gamma crystallin-related protein [Pseudomonadota bacterium]